VVLGSSFGGFVVLTYAALFPGHPGGRILPNTNGDHFGCLIPAVHDKPYQRPPHQTDEGAVRVLSPRGGRRRGIAGLDVNARFCRDVSTERCRYSQTE
jgi:hypothetical protein